MKGIPSSVARRQLVQLGLVAFATGLFRSYGAQAAPIAAGATPANGAKVILLGTKGGPRVGGARSNPANALMVNGAVYVIDTGMGVTSQLLKAGVDLETIRSVFISHMHSDHQLEFGNLIYNIWIAGLLKKPIQAYGPVGLQQMAADYWRLNQSDITTRMADEGRSDPSKLLVTHDLQGAGGKVMEDGLVNVSFLSTPHPPLKNFAYRFDTPHGSAVFSGDTAYCSQLGDFAHGADVLVHETLYLSGVDALVKRIGGGPALRNHLIESHTPAEQVGMVAARAGVKKLVLSHFVPGDMTWITEAMWRKEAAKHFKGEIIVGRDLLEVQLG